MHLKCLNETRLKDADRAYDALVTRNDMGYRIIQNIIRKLQDPEEICLISDRYDDSVINP